MLQEKLNSDIQAFEEKLREMNKGLSFPMSKGSFLESLSNFRQELREIRSFIKKGLR